MLGQLFYEKTIPFSLNGPFKQVLCSLYNLEMLKTKMPLESALQTIEFTIWNIASRKTIIFDHEILCYCHGTTPNKKHPADLVVHYTPHAMHFKTALKLLFLRFCCCQLNKTHFIISQSSPWDMKSITSSKLKEAILIFWVNPKCKALHTFIEWIQWYWIKICLMNKLIWLWQYYLRFLINLIKLEEYYIFLKHDKQIWLFWNISSKWAW